MIKLKTVDLFAGAGGLSLGFTQTNLYDIKVAFENNKNMQDTYRYNHKQVEVFGDVCDADYQKIKERYGEIDVVIGGPPCQGFSNANRQKNTAINQNNMLVKQYIRAILELRPKAFVMENVSMLRSEVHRFYMSKTDVEIVSKYKIPVKNYDLVLLEERFSFQEAVDIVKSYKKIKAYLWEEDQYAKLNIVYKASKNIEKMLNALKKHKNILLKYAEKVLASSEVGFVMQADRRAFRAIEKFYKGEFPKEDILGAIEPAIMIQRMLNKAGEIFCNDIVVDEYNARRGVIAKIKSFAVYDYLEAVLGSEKYGYRLVNDVLCAANYGAPQKRKRFVLMGVQKQYADKIALPRGVYDEDQYRTVRDAIEDLEELEPSKDVKNDTGILLKPAKLSNLAKSLRDAKKLHNHIITNTTETAMTRFQVLKQGENFHALEPKLKTNTYTDVTRTQNTIYLRLNYDEPCGTVVNVRKSMWIHPKKDRAVSIREAARLQTFPDSFVFCGTKDQQYQQVGNAVPPIMAKAIAVKLAKLLTSKNNKKAR